MTCSCEASFSSAYIAGKLFALPGFGEAVRGRLFGRSGDAHGGADDEGDERQRAERQRARKQSSTTLGPRETACSLLER